MYELKLVPFKGMGARSPKKSASPCEDNPRVFNILGAKFFAFRILQPFAEEVHP
jgi:hypothetical protein